MPQSVTWCQVKTYIKPKQINSPLGDPIGKSGHAHKDIKISPSSSPEGESVAVFPGNKPRGQLQVFK